MDKSKKDIERFNNNLNNNPNISEEFKELARESFGELFEMLGKEGFIKWLKIRSINRDVKELLFKWADSEELGLAVAGDYNEFDNRIRIKKEEEPLEIKGIAKHEELHFFSRFGYLKRRCPYLNEGCTEYLKHLSDSPEDEYTYKEQVEVVRFFHKFLGDSIIKTYLTGEKEYFFNDLKSILEEDILNEEDIEDSITDFFDCLNNRFNDWKTRHNRLTAIFSGIKVDDEDIGYSVFEDDEEEEYNDELIKKFFERIIYCKFKQMAKARYFNKNGQVDEEFAKSVIREKLKYARFVGQEYDYFDNETDFSNYIIEIMMDKILYGIRKNCNPKIVVDDYSKNSKKLCDYEMCSIEEIYTQIFESRRKIPTISFFDYLIKTYAELGLPSEEMCKEYNVENLCKILANNSTRNLAVFNFLAKEVTSVESHFRKIGDSEYVEQRDGAFVYLKINDDGTIQEETDISKLKNIFWIGDTLESIRLVNRDDDYKELGVLSEEQFQQVEMVYQMIQSILYQKNVNVENEVKDMNVIIQDTKFLRNIVETVLRKRTRLQVMDWINVLTEDEMNQVLEQIYDEAVNTSGMGEIEQLQELKEYSKNLFDYKYGPRE